MSEKTFVKVGLIVLAVVVAWWLMWNTNPGKKLSAQVGLRDCVEITITGNVVCGDQADELQELRDGLGSGSNLPSCDDITAAAERGKCIQP